MVFENEPNIVTPQCTGPSETGGEKVTFPVARAGRPKEGSAKTDANARLELLELERGGAGVAGTFDPDGNSPGRGGA